MSKPEFCDMCHDGDGHSVYPYYGVGPHTCGYKMGKPVIGHSVGIPAAEWPANFLPDEEYGDQDDGRPPLGAYTHCLHCGAGAEENRRIRAAIDAQKAGTTTTSKETADARN